MFKALKEHLWLAKNAASLIAFAAEERAEREARANESSAQLVDNGEVLREAVGRLRAITEAAPAAGAKPAQQPAAPETPAAPLAPKRELHELSTEELRAATRQSLNELFGHLDGERPTRSPFFRGSNKPEDTDR
jgi:membrane protein involved in colicin uptake